MDAQNPIGLQVLSAHVPADRVGARKHCVLGLFFTVAALAFSAVGCVSLPNAGGGKNPFPDSKFTVFILEESSARTEPQASIWNSTILRKAVKDRGGDFEILDADNLTKNDKYKAAAEKSPPKDLPWLYMGKNRKGFVGPPPEQLDGFLNRVKEIGD